MRHGHSSYLRNIFNPDALKDSASKVNRKLNELKRQGVPIDILAYRGQSGSGIAFALSVKYGWKLAGVRKKELSSHGRMIEMAEGDYHDYVIVDDLIASGRTVEAIIDQLHPMRCQAIVLYDDYKTSTFKSNGVKVYTVG